MALPPTELPDSITLGVFDGVKNIVSPERLGARDLEAAINVDLDDAGQARRRRGYDQLLAGACHSAYGFDDTLLLVKDGVLGSFINNAFSAMTPVGIDPLSYTRVGDTIYFSSRAASGKFDRSLSTQPWGETGGAGEWLSPVVVPNALLGAISGKLLGPPPLATSIEAYSGRIYLAYDKVIWATELFLYDRVDRTRNYLQMEKPVTVLGSVDDGMYVGTEAGLFFLKGVLSQGMGYQQLTSAPVLRGSMSRVPGEIARASLSDGAKRVEQALMVVAEDGIYACFAGGEAYNLTRDRVAFPKADNAAVLFRQDAGVNSFVVAADSAGGPSANARIGDHVDAEIRRFQGG